MPLWNRIRERLSPLVYLSNNPLSLAGVVLVTAAAVFWIFLLPVSVPGEMEHPYIGILAFLLLPAVFFAGLALIPFGIYRRWRREKRRGLYPSSFPPLDLRHPELRQLLTFVLAATAVNIVIASQTTYRAVTYMDSPGFCGRTCHTVMQPEFTAYQNSPHSHIECVKCHIGPGASWFVRSKLAGAGRVFAVALHAYPRPIPAPVQNLRPAREICEACHWPQYPGDDHLQVITKFAADEANTATKTVLLMHIGEGGRREVGIHGAHLGGVLIEYGYSDRDRQKIPWVRYTSGDGRSTVYLASGADSAAAQRLPRQIMDCMDCHNRPAHTFDLPDRALDRALAAGDISAALPFAKKQGLEVLQRPYGSTEEAALAIPSLFEQYYKEQYPQIYAARRAEVSRSGRALAAIFNRNVFPAMRVTWGTYPNNIGHTDFPGCFRCHDDQHLAAGGRKIPQDCSSCHNLLAIDDPAPQILAELGLAAPAPGR